ncbi:MAG: hypothetical protein OIN87_07110 [Candidatus Methanoperedens sp.]|nr:hypothetical protein [Candidatus Methanoperedens sp.]
MDELLGNFINDFAIYRVIQGIITIFTLVAVYLGVQIILMWRSLNNAETNPDKVISNRSSFIRSCVFIFIAGFFMLFHNFLESLGNNEPDFATYESFELIALLGLILFLNEWYKILKSLKKAAKSSN